LTALDDELNLIPWLAESWENIDELTWEFKIRQGVVFHDGTPLTAEDFKFSFEHVLDPANESRRLTQVSIIQTVETPDDFTLRLITAEPAAALLSKLQAIYALPAATYQEMGPEQFALNPVGTGPYRVAEWVRDSHVRLERYDDYWRGPVELETAEFRPIPEAATRVAALQAGELDVATLIPTIDVPVIEANPDLSIRQVPSLRVIFCGMNTFAEPFTDVRVRQALNYAVDVQSIIDNLLSGFGTRLASVSGPAEFGFNPNLEPYPYDPERAMQLLTEAGFPNGFSTTLDTPIGRYLQDVEVSQAIAGMLGEVGVQVEVRQAEFNEYFDRWLAEDIEGLYFLGNGATTLDADGVMDGHFDSERRGLYYNSPESDEMIHAALQEFDPARREALYHELMAYLHDQAPWIFLYVQEDIYGTAANLVWAPRPDETLNVWSMSWS
jgi:peptide/nickel transport system substrate-binding protein